MYTEDFVKDCLQHPPYFGYRGDLDLFNTWGITPFAVHRDSNCRERSNWEVIAEDLQKRFPEAFDEIHCGHWGVGWIDHLCIDTTNEEAVAAAYEWVRALENYPIANEEHCSELEWNEKMDAYSSWARYDVGRYIEEWEIGDLLDKDGDFDPTDEQEETLTGLVADCLETPESSVDWDEFKRLIEEEFC